MTERVRAAFDAEAKRLAGLPLERFERQIVADQLAAELAHWYGKVVNYADPFDWAAQAATVLLAEFSITRRPETP